MLSGVAKYKGEVLFDLSHATEPGERCRRAGRAVRRAPPRAAALRMPPLAPACRTQHCPPPARQPLPGAKVSDSIAAMKGKVMAGVNAYIAAHNLRSDDGALLWESSRRTPAATAGGTRF